MADDTENYGAAVPRSRFARMSRFGRLAAGMAGEALGQSVQALAKGDRLTAQGLLLTPSNADRLARELAHLRGAAMKMGQMLSMDSGDVLPPELSDVLSRLRESATAMPPHQLKRVLTQNWGPNWLKRFKRFEAKPMAAASIGQVHRAWLRDGRELAIKVQYPGVRDSIDADVDNMASLITVSGLAPKGMDLSAILAEVKRQLRDEADYAREAAMLKRFRAWLTDHPLFTTPEVVDSLTTQNILAMSFVSGEPIEAARDALPSERNQILTALIELTLREIFEFGAIQSDPNFANFRYDAATGRIGLLDFGAVQDIPPLIQTGARDLLRAGLTSDRDGLTHALTSLGYLGADTQDAQRTLVLELTDMAFTPLFSESAYTFDGSALIERMREGGLQLRQMGYAQTPEPMALFLQRKIGGLYLLGARLEAEVSIRPLLEAYTRTPL